MREAMWLARWEIRRVPWSYALTGLLWVLPGLLVWSLFHDTFRDGQEWAAALGADIFFLSICSALGGNFGAQESWRMTSASCVERLSFRRSMPISAVDLATGRALAIMPALVCNAAGLFLTPYVLSAATGGAIAREVGVYTYVCFAAIWIAYGLVYAGVHVYGEMAVRVPTYNGIFALTLLPAVVVTAVAHLAFGTGVVAATLDLARTYGPAPAGLALLFGVGATVLWLAAASRRLARRDLLA